MGFYTTPGGGYGATGSADPYFRYHQLERLGGVAQLLMGMAQQRQQREQERMDQRIKLAASAVANGGDLAEPAVQGVLTDMRALSQKKQYKHLGYDRTADLLESIWKNQENDLEHIQRRVNSAAMDLMQQSDALPGSIAPDGSEPPKLDAYDAQELAYEKVPGGARAKLADMGASAYLRERHPEYFRAPQQDPAAIRLHQRAVDVLQNPEAASPAEVQWAKVYMKNAPAPEDTTLSPEAKAVQARFDEDNRREDARRAHTDLVASLSAESRQQAADWRNENVSRRTAAGGTPDLEWQKKNPRPRVYSVEKLAAKIEDVMAADDLQDDEKQALVLTLKQAAAEEGDVGLEAMWRTTRGRVKKAAGAKGTASAGGR